MSEDSERVIKPSLHHVNIKTTRLQEMIDWYIAVVGAKVNFRFPGGHFCQTIEPTTGSHS